MAEISNNSGGEGRGRKIRSKKLSTKIDMTPMVDLAFLLLTFFMLANSLLKPFAMDIVMPEKDDEGKAPKIRPKNILSLTLGADNKIYYTNGLGTDIKVTSYSASGIRKILIDNIANNPKLYVLIKPTEKARFQNIVDIFDEMEILKIPKYALVDPTPFDLDLIKTINK
ncbi:MAG TPA: biopolymer transporter ExbD [Cytophagales bacterium]|nr:biopolymer transporter ExbD [Cytophagales bacterium]